MHFNHMNLVADQLCRITQRKSMLMFSRAQMLRAESARAGTAGETRCHKVTKLQNDKKKKKK